MRWGSSHHTRMCSLFNISFLYHLIVTVDCLWAKFLRILHHKVECIREAWFFVHLATPIDHRLSVGSPAEATFSQLALACYSTAPRLPLTCLIVSQAALVMDLVVTLDVAGLRPIRVASELSHFFLIEQLLAILVYKVDIAHVGLTKSIVLLFLSVSLLLERDIQDRLLSRLLLVA